MGVFELYFTGVTTSEKYDTTLMICLLRNLTSIMPPTLGFDRLPPPAEKGDGADLARIKYYRNMFAHPEDHVMTTADFKVAWKTLTEVTLTDFIFKHYHLLNYYSTRQNTSYLNNLNCML